VHGVCVCLCEGYEGDGSHIGEGIRFGTIVAIIIDGFAVTWNYVTEPIARGWACWK